MDERNFQRNPNSLSYDGGASVTWQAGDQPPLESVKRMRARSEGPRSRSTRLAIVLRYVAYFVTAVVGCLATNAFLTMSGTTSYGGSLMWFSVTLMFVTAAVGTGLFPNNRTEIFSQMRHYVFGLCLFPGTAIAAVIWALRDVLTSPTAQSDTLASLINFAVPAIFVTTVVLPPIIFVKAVAGYYSLQRSRLSDSEMMAIYNRQDPSQR